MSMSDISLHPVNATLLALLDNQCARTEAAFEGLRDDVFTAEPGHNCNSIRAIAHHLIKLRRFQLMLLESPAAASIADPDGLHDQSAVLAALHDATERFRTAVAEHDGDDWTVVPATPRAGKWGDEATLVRVIRPLNDFTNHLGSIRAIRRMMGNPNDRTQ